MSTTLFLSAGAAEPVTPADLRRYFERAGKPASRWKVGAEFEKFGVHRRDGRPLAYAEPGGVRDTLAALADRFGWRPHHEAGHLTALTKGGTAVSLEPGGQVELSAAPSRSLDGVRRQLAEHLAELRAAAPHAAWLAAGVHPTADAAAVPPMPRQRHAVMAEYLPVKSPTAPVMMKATASVQIALDYADETDAVRKFTAALKLGPLVNAAFGNSPYHGGRPTGCVSYRGAVWHGMDPDRSGLLVPLLARGVSFASWLDYLLDVPMMFTCLGGRYRPAHGRTFREFMARGIDGRFPSVADWEVHVTTVFPEVRLKTFIEVRGADAVGGPLALSVPAVWKGLFYDADALDAAARLAARLRPDELPSLFESAYRWGLAATFRGRSVGEWCREVAEIAANGLPAEERPYLDPLFEVLDRGRSPGMAAVGNPPAEAADLVRRFEWV